MGSQGILIFFLEISLLRYDSLLRNHKSSFYQKSEEVDFSKKRIPTLWPVKPEQHNNFDSELRNATYMADISV